MLVKHDRRAVSRYLELLDAVYSVVVVGKKRFAAIEGSVTSGWENGRTFLTVLFLIFISCSIVFFIFIFYFFIIAAHSVVVVFSLLVFFFVGCCGHSC